MENLCIIFLTKKDLKMHFLNTNSELSQKRTEKQIMLSKIVINWLFNDI